MILTWVWNLKPWGYQKYALPGICACIVAIVGAVGREDISHREDEAQQPGHEDSQDDLERSRAEFLLSNTSLSTCTHHPKAAIVRTMQNNCFNETVLRVMQVNSLSLSKVWLVKEWAACLQKPRGVTSQSHWQESFCGNAEECDLIFELEPYRHLDFSLWGVSTPMPSSQRCRRVSL